MGAAGVLSTNRITAPITKCVWCIPEICRQANVWRGLMATIVLGEISSSWTTSSETCLDAWTRYRRATGRSRTIAHDRAQARCNAGWPRSPPPRQLDRGQPKRLSAPPRAAVRDRKKDRARIAHNDRARIAHNDRKKRSRTDRAQIAHGSRTPPRRSRTTVCRRLCGAGPAESAVRGAAGVLCTREGYPGRCMAVRA